jgi:hypothetical protein
LPRSALTLAQSAMGLQPVHLHRLPSNAPSTCADVTRVTHPDCCCPAAAVAAAVLALQVPLLWQLGVPALSHVARFCRSEGLTPLHCCCCCCCCWFLLTPLQLLLDVVSAAAAALCAALSSAACVDTVMPGEQKPHWVPWKADRRSGGSTRQQYKGGSTRTAVQGLSTRL